MDNVTNYPEGCPPPGPGPLEAMRELSAELGRVSVQGASGPEEDSRQGELLKLVRLREQVKHQQLELQNMIEASDVSPDFLPEEKLVETTRELEQEIENLKVSYQNKTLALQRIQLVHALQTKMQENSSDSMLIQDMMKHILALSSSILKSQQETRDLEEKLYEVRKKRLVLKELGSKMMLQMQTLKRDWKQDLEVIENDKLKKILQILEKQIHITTVVQCVFQSLILGSRVNWAEDPKLKDIVLKLEQNAASL
ncbi:centromere protein H [Ascaphus truei]|uniref:centromere protein H n=1 Tax=Ascaphus truei TaxID=8439 RepID=UPI003F5A9A37